MTVAAPRARNATEDAILAAARAAIAELGFERTTIDRIAKRAFVSRTAVYFYFPNKRAVVDRLIQRAFTDIHAAASPYIEGGGDPHRELRRALGQVFAAIDRNADMLLLALRLYGQEDRLPPEWEPYIRRLVAATERRIRRDQESGRAATRVDPAICAQALTAMVERHVTLEVVRGGRSATESIRALAELWWRAVYAGGAPGA